MIKTTPQFRDLLRDCRVQSGYTDVLGRRRRASIESLLLLLRYLGVEIDRPEQVGDVLRERRRAHMERGVEPVLVAWNGRLKPVSVALPASFAGPIAFELDVGGERITGVRPVEELDSALLPDDATFDYVIHKLPVRRLLPAGYHRLTILAENKIFRSLVISAPRRAFDPAKHAHHGRESAAGTDGQSHDAAAGARRRGREWGNFLPLYALRHQRDWGTGDFTALGELARWTGKLGGAAVGTLPLLAASLDEPFESSPYRPVSRLFWNELYVDIEAIGELQACSDCRQVVESADFRRRLEELRGAETVNYREVMWLKRQALSALAAYFFDARPASRFAEFQCFVAENPDLEYYARFRAAEDRQRADWLSWPPPMRERLGDADYNPADLQYHLYAQWIAAEQLAAVKQTAEQVGCGLYLDLPVGVDTGGYDVWRHQQLFVTGVTTGAPPDAFFTRGQDWGLPPLQPERLRETGYGLLRQLLAANMKYARYLRIDHAMGWHRLYWIASGLRADQGAYVRYPADEFYAIASLESHRHGCTLLAENMGTVPPEVNRSLQRHGIGGMWVAPYELEPSRRRALTPPAPLSVASLNTHDMPPAAAWWHGDDIADRLDLGLLRPEQADAEQADRRQAADMLRDWLRTTGALPLSEEDQETPMAALLRMLAASPAQLVLVNLEDLWLERRPQNVPGTTTERPNWQRKARYTLEEFMEMSDVQDVLNQINALRHRNEKPR